MEIPALAFHTLLGLGSAGCGCPGQGTQGAASTKSALPKPSQFVPQVLSQLQACGIVEAITISAAGFPVR